MKKKRARLFILLKYLYENTDMEHKASTSELLSYLADMGMGIDRHTLVNDLKLLEQEGYGVEKDEGNGKANQYYIENREFSIPELKLLIDAVSTLDH